MDFTEDEFEQDLGALVELLETDPRPDLRALGAALHDGKLTIDIIDQEYDLLVYRAVLHVPTTYRSATSLGDVETEVLDLLARIILPADGYLKLAVIRYQPARGNWRRGGPTHATKDIIGDRFRLGRSLGEGGFGVVFEAIDIVDNTSTAVKFLKHPENAAHDDQYFNRMAREIRALGAINHENVINIITYGQSPATGQLWYAMPLAEASLKARLDSLARDEASILTVLSDIAAGLDHLHEHQIIHRDLTPGNVLVSEGRWKLADLGLAVQLERVSDALTKTVMGLGTAGYQPPEFMNAKDATAQWDNYSLGQVCLDLITGKTFDQRRGDPEPAHVFMPAVRRALSNNPKDRFATATDFVTECRRLHQIASSPPWESTAEAMERWREALSSLDTALAAFDEMVTAIEGNRAIVIELLGALQDLPQGLVTYLHDERPGRFQILFDAVVAELPYRDIPFHHLDWTADFLTKCIEFEDPYAIKALRWIAEEGDGWNQWYVMRLAARLTEQLLRTRPHLIRPALDGLRPSALDNALPEGAVLRDHLRPRSSDELRGDTSN